ncbi:MAG TPA: dTDP-4-dehydrorhamnose 3,5-epimerase [Nitrospirales bacterium]|nr:dTDP-4-dehydrorhamnose 3,5-epimerase [Nitrospirales bacterium]
MRITPTALPDVLLIEPDVWTDPRGYFFESYHQSRYEEHGIHARFVQDNFSRSLRGTLRGLHYQLMRPQGKLVTVMEGVVFDVAVDIRRSSPTFGRWVGVELSAEKQAQLYIPPGFAHGFCVLSPTAGFHYKCTEYYAPEDERGIIWNDVTLKIAWPIDAPTLSAKDRHYFSLKDLPPDALPA